MKIKIASYADRFRDTHILKVYEATTPPSKDDVLILDGKGYYVVARSPNLDGVEPEWIVFIRPVGEK